MSIKKGKRNYYAIRSATVSQGATCTNTRRLHNSMSAGQLGPMLPGGSRGLRQRLPGAPEAPKAPEATWEPPVTARDPTDVRQNSSTQRTTSGPYSRRSLPSICILTARVFRVSARAIAWPESELNFTVEFYFGWPVVCSYILSEVFSSEVRNPGAGNR